MADQEVLVIDRAQSPQVTPETIQETVQSISLLQDMVRNTLLRDIDYGRIPGTPQDSLWDPGASMIIGSFNCYCGQRRILRLEDNDSKIVACVEVPIISRKLQREVGSGIGAASTLETKYKYRWVASPKEWGYDEAAIKTFKTKRGRDDGKDTLVYRIPNPEHSELLNTIIKMASKRAEVDAAEALPGVSSVLRQIFSGKAPRQDRKAPEDDYASPRWQRFWGEVTRLGYTEAEAHTKIGVRSMHDWLAQNHTLDEALTILRRDGEPQHDDGLAGSEEVNTSILANKYEGVKDASDAAWIRDAIRHLNWRDVGTYIKEHYADTTGANVGEAIENLTATQKQDFITELRRRLDTRTK